MNSALQSSNTNAAQQRGILSTIDLLELLWRRRSPIGIGMLVGILLGILYYLVTPTKFESQADVLLVQKHPQAVTNDQRYESGFEDFLATHRALIVSPLIVERAIEAGDLRSLKTFADVDPEEDDLAEIIIEDLEAGGGSRELGDSADSIMTLAFQGTDEEECPLVVQAIVDSYKSFLDETYRGMSDDVMQLIGKARDLLRNDLQKQEENYAEFRQRSPLVARGTDEVNPLQERLAAIETQRSDLLIRRTEVQGQLTAIENAKRDEYDDERLLALVADMRQQTQGIDGFFSNTSTTLDAQLIQLTDREQQLMEHFGPKHPHVSTIRQRIEATRKLQTLPTAAHLPPSTLENGSTSSDAAELYTQFLKQELVRIDTSEQLLTNLYEREHTVAKDLSGYQLKDERYQRDITRTQQLYDEVISQLQEASLVKGIGGFEARVIAPPKVGKKASPSLKIVGAASVFLGLCFGFGVALLLEFRDSGSRPRQEDTDSRSIDSDASSVQDIE